MKKLRVLNVEDSENDSTLLIRHLTRGGYDIYVERVENQAEMKAALESKEWDIIISDYQMPKFNGLLALNVLHESGLDIPFIIISGTIGEVLAVEAMVAGVNDYMMKDNLARLIPAIERELQEARHRKARYSAENNLKESEKRLKIALSAGGMGVWEWKIVTDNLFWSSECYEIIGRSEPVASLKDFTDLLYPEDFDLVMNLVRNAIETRKPLNVEFRIINPNDEIKWLASFGQAEYDDNGDPQTFIGTVQDITERKKSEESLRESEEKFRALVQATTQFVWSANSNLVTDVFPDWWTELTGQKIENTRNWGWLEALHPEDREPTQKIWKNAQTQKSLFNTILRIKTKNGGYRFFAARGVPIFNQSGNLVRWIGALTDITERTLSEEELKQSERRFRSLVSATAQIVWIADTDGMLLSALTPNGDSIEGTGANINEDWISRIHPDDKERVLAEFSKAVKNKNDYHCEYQMFYTDDQYHHFIARGIPVFEKNGKVQEWVGTLTDVTENKISEIELQKKEEQLQQAQKLETVGRLAGGIAHDFNNMLTVINGYSDLLLRGLNSNDPMRQKVEEIKTAGERAAELTNQLLAFSRRSILKTKVLDVNQIVSDTTIMIRRLIGEDIQVIKDLDLSLNKIEADSGQLAQIIMNLVINSRDAMPQGGIISIKTANIFLNEDFVNQNIGTKVGDYILLEISDTGIGMDDEVKSHIFEPFFTTKEVGQGTGLGLSTVYGIVTQFGGHIIVQSEINKGTSFRIYLPSLNDSTNDLETNAGSNKFSIGTETILLVEDEKLVRKLSRQMLESSGYKVIEAQNGIEAIEIARNLENKIDLLITDVVMPKMSGRELANELYKICPRVLFISGYTDDDVMRHGISKVNFNFLQKPFTFNEFTQKVREVLDKKL